MSNKSECRQLKFDEPGFESHLDLKLFLITIIKEITVHAARVV